MKKLGFIGMLICACCQCFAQSDFDVLKEVRLSGRYYYGEATGKDTVLILQQARQQLMEQITRRFMSLAATGNGKDSSLTLGDVRARVMSYGLRYKAIVYIDTMDVGMKQRTPRKELNIIPIVIAPPGAKESPPAVLDQLQSQAKPGDLYRLLQKLQRSGKLSFSTKEENVLDPAACYIAVIDKQEKKILAMLSKDAANRTDLLNHQPVKNFKQQFPKADFIWVYVY